MNRHEEQLRIGAVTTLDEPVVDTIVCSPTSYLILLEIIAHLSCLIDERCPSSGGQVEGGTHASQQRKSKQCDSKAS